MPSQPKPPKYGPEASGCALALALRVAVAPKDPAWEFWLPPPATFKSERSSVSNMIARPSRPHFHQLGTQPHAEEARHVPSPACAMETAPGGSAGEHTPIAQGGSDAMLAGHEPGMGGRCSLPSSHCAGETSHHMRTKYFSSS